MNYVLLVITIILFARLFLIKKEIKNISKQLKGYNEFKTGKKINVQFIDKGIEELAQDINENLNISDERLIRQRASEEELKRAISYVSHDLRTPLTTILGCLHMINKENVSEERKEEYLSMAEKRGERLQELLNEFFSLSTVESPDYKVNLEYINLNNILCDKIASFYEKFSSKDIEPGVYLPNDNLTIIGDISAIDRILDNIISNSIKYCDGEINIALKEENKKAVITVENATTILTNNDVANIFEKFYTGEKSRNVEEGSTGLGLSISKILVEKLGGKISCALKNSVVSIRCEFDLKSQLDSR